MKLQWFARIVGIVFLLIGLIGFFVEEWFGLIQLDIVQNCFHLLVGIVGILVSFHGLAAKIYTQVLGIVYVLLGIFGFFIPEPFANLTFETTENIVYIVVGVIALYLGFVPSAREVKAANS